MPTALLSSSSLPAHPFRLLPLAGCILLSLPASPAQAADAPGHAGAETLDRVTVTGRQQRQATSTRLPLTPRETPQSVSQIDRETLDTASITNLNDALTQVTGVNVSMYDTQRPVYFARGFQITDFQVDNVPSYSNSSNLEYDTALYERIEVVRGANGLLSGTGSPSATINMLRKRPGAAFDASVRLMAGSWRLRRGEADLNLPLDARGAVRSRWIVMRQRADSFRDRYHEDKTAGMGAIEADLGGNTTLFAGYQMQRNDPRGSTWGGLPLFMADGTPSDLPLGASFAPAWTYWRRDSATAFLTLEHRLGNDWNLHANLSRTRGELESLRIYGKGIPDAATGRGITLLGGRSSTRDVRDTVDVYARGTYPLLGRRHELVVGINAMRHESESDVFKDASGPGGTWSYDIPDYRTWRGDAPMPVYLKTGATRVSPTRQTGIYASTRFHAGARLSFIAGARLGSWRTRTDNRDAQGRPTGVSGAYRVDRKLTPYFGVLYDISPNLSAYASYTDIFNPQNRRDKHNNLLPPLLGSNLEAGLKGEWLDKRLQASAAVFRTGQNNYPVRDPSEPEGSLPDGGSAYIATNGTRSSGFELEVSGAITPQWRIGSGYTHVKIKRHPLNPVWATLPENRLHISTYYQFDGALSGLMLGGGLNWQSRMTGVQEAHPVLGRHSYAQGGHTLLNLHANYAFNEHLDATLSITNATNKKYWANLDTGFGNYGEPRNTRLSLRWRY
ncbi:TonB-dependent siderophore receptor [Lysobacter pythonis]|uniref:TonB-dependent siderophore receptor n=1 Tax=Solilutibacter pythonis TaxID=2483112 RepID=A0A3M2HYV3_9GAMM|nr:TonB-dependent siderophore receptor [Lysobacter pythonis]RMH91024.1 TonB-dependent siderophore receptor [Lysobacter pythonis]